MRIALGSGGLAVLSAIAAAIVAPPRPAVVTTTSVDPGPSGPPPTAITVQQPVQYIQLLPGQTAPPGATVIDPAAPTPLTIVTTITAPPRPVQKPIIIRTTQSGKVIP
jgi:hypothetical protein